MIARVTHGSSNNRLDVLSRPFESDRMFDDLYGELPIGIYRAAGNGELLAANRTLVRMFGCVSLDDLKNGAVREPGLQLVVERPELRERLNVEGEIKEFE